MHNVLDSSLKLIFAVLIVFNCSVALSQSIAEGLQTINTSFIFTSNDIPLDVKQQWIVKRPVDSESSRSDQVSVLSDLYFLEIEIWSELEPMEEPRRFFSPSYVLTFYNKRNEVLGKVSRGFSRVERTTIELDRNSEVRYYAIDLRGIPMLMLNEAHRIDFVQYSR